MRKKKNIQEQSGEIPEESKYVTVKRTRNTSQKEEKERPRTRKNSQEEEKGQSRGGVRTIKRRRKHSPEEE
jgi:hypothetical protein